MVPATAATGFLPDPAALAPDLLARVVAMYFASPANPQGAVVSLEGWQSLISLARRHDFMLLADECYSEIHRGRPPAGVLEAALAMGGGFDRVVTFNSLSKRSNLPGLRCGFAAGDPDFLGPWSAFRNMAAPQVPNPMQAVAVAAYADEAHVAENRALYDAKYAVAERILGPRFGTVTPEGGFFLWLDVAGRAEGCGARPVCASCRAAISPPLAPTGSIPAPISSALPWSTIWRRPKRG
jgi:aspartate/methionine/tyrosine aminotransferase